ALKQVRSTQARWKEHLSSCHLPWVATPFDLEAIDFLKSLGMKIWKVPSGMVTNERYLYAVAKAREETEGEIILSTGLSNMNEIMNAYKIIGTRLIILHCVSLYPTPPREMNIGIFKEFGWRWPYQGLSDHSEGYEMAIAAVALGATVIEKHITLDRSLPGPDHASSLDPFQFKEMVRCIRNVELALAGNNKPALGELDKIKAIRDRMELI
ncbi:MAG: N-acetylneuraminate synthase family protein, partial [Pseudomonadota bacterium]